MGLFDDFNVLVGRGMNTVDRKSQAFKLQAELNRIANEKEKAFADLGRAVYVREGMNSTYTEHVQAIANLDSQEANLQQQLAGLQRVNDNRQSRHACPVCGNLVSLDSPHCPICGDNLAALKSQFRRCPNCNSYFSADSFFCEQCGGRTIELEISASAPRRDTNVRDDSNVGQRSICPHCGGTIRSGTIFCGNCGQRIEGDIPMPQDTFIQQDDANTPQS